MQLEAYLGGVWTPITRYDTAHRFVHRDDLKPDGADKSPPMAFASYGDAMNYAIRDLPERPVVHRKVFAMEKLTPEQVADKVFELTEQFNQYVFDNPDVLNDIPDKATLVFLDADDPEFNRANIELARAMPRPTDSPVVYMRMQKRVRVVQQVEWMPQVVASPLAV